MRTTQHNRGFTAFFAVLVSSLALAVGLSIYDLLLREIALSQTTRDSQAAIFAADTGVECALYWDNKAPVLNGFPSVFGTSTAAGAGAWTSAATYCNTQNILTQGPLAIDLTQYPGCAANAWCKVAGVNAATTTFSVILNTNGATTFGATTTCATVVVAKSGNPAQTTVTSHGFSTCFNNGAVRLERTLQVTY